MMIQNVSTPLFYRLGYLTNRICGVLVCNNVGVIFFTFFSYVNCIEYR